MIFLDLVKIFVIILLPTIFFIEIFSRFKIVVIVKKIKTNFEKAFLLISSKEISDEIKQKKILFYSLSNIKLSFNLFLMLLSSFMSFMIVYFFEKLLFSLKNIYIDINLLISIKTQIIIFSAASLYLYLKTKISKNA